jgi:hypothetical protein
VTSRPTTGRGTVVLYSCKPRSAHGHEFLTQREISHRLAAIKEFDFAEEFDPLRRYDRPLYFVPSDTLTSASARKLCVSNEHDLFGGVVPFPFVGTKTITHALPEKHAFAPTGWSTDFARLAAGQVLPGFSAFTPEDARNAALRLLQQGRVRIKKASGVGGLGQFIIGNVEQLDQCLTTMDASDLSRDGVVVEANLTKVSTYSVGQVHVGKFLATYCGTQKLTTSNHGEAVYGGSTLTVVRGDFDALLLLKLEQPFLTAIAQARAYHAAALASYPGMFTSRTNYDVAQGVDDKGEWHSGVLEQSWRIGGASAAELGALGAFRADPAVSVVRASTMEVYGEDVTVPEAGVLHYKGVDEQLGPLTKYSLIEPYANA